MSSTGNRPAPNVDLEQLVAEADTGGRKPTGIAAADPPRRRDLLVAVPALVRLAAAVHVRLRHSQRHRSARNPSRPRAVPRLHGLSGVQVIAARATFPRSTGCWRWPARSPAPTCSCSNRSSRCGPGQPTTLDLVTAGAGILLLLEATRRSLGLPMVFVAAFFILFTFAGPYMPEAVQHKGASLSRFLHASMARHRGRVRHRARRLDELRLPVRAVRHAAGQGRRRQLDDADLDRAARPSARRRRPRSRWFPRRSTASSPARRCRTSSRAASSRSR